MRDVTLGFTDANAVALTFDVSGSMVSRVINEFENRGGNEMCRVEIGKWKPEPGYLK